MLQTALDHKYFSLYANCIPVKGASRSLICDLQRRRYHFIPNDLFEILNDNNRCSLNEILNYYGEENRETLVEYFDFLTSEEYIFFCEKDEISLFPKLDLTWDSPSRITNAIIDVGIEYQHDFQNILLQLEELGCKALQLRFYKAVGLEHLSSILHLLYSSGIVSVEIILPFSNGITEEDLRAFAHQHLRVNLLAFYGAPENMTVDDSSLPASIVFLKELIADESHCGVISASNFAINIEAFTEAIHYNSCLNRKISIDRWGQIKNCPSMKRSYGSISRTSLATALGSQGFKDHWSVNKDQIEICKDCEFRYICTDCRAFTLDDKHYSKPFKCAYDPYSCSWK